MKVSQNWLKELVEINTSAQNLSEKLSIGGFEVESLQDCSLQVKGVLVGKVLSVKKHLDSDKLTICEVDIGVNKCLQIICGAKNIKSDIFVYVATVGSYLSSINLIIKRSEIRGVVSEGMICSLQELGLEEKSEGIAIIDNEQVTESDIGKLASDFLNLDDFIYDLAITANRPDGMSVVGISREISALLETKLNLPKIQTVSEIKVFNPSYLCPEAINSDCIYTISFIDNVDGNLLSPKWIKERLEKSDVKSINLIVDITNYVLLEQGQPLHAFDREKLSELIGKEVQPSDFGVRKAAKGEELLAIDGNTYKLNENITIITCDDKPVAIAGIIGGLETSVTNSTKSIVLEAAVFSPLSIRKSSKEVGLRSESSSRFEKGISSKNTFLSVNRSLMLLNEFLENLNFQIFSNKLEFDVVNTIKLRRERIHKILGNLISTSNIVDNKINPKREITDKEIEHKLNLIGCSLINKDYGWDVQVIPNRSNDLKREIDLIEEIARLIGYDHFDQNLPSPIQPGRLSKSQQAINDVKSAFINSGFNEILTYSLVPNDNSERIKISNPLLMEISCLRNDMWKEHINICEKNIKAGKEHCWIFEIGNIFNDDFTQIEILNGVICGNNRFESWDLSGKKNELNYYQARGKLKEALSFFNISIIDKPTKKIDFLHPGRSSTLFIEGKEVGYFGQLNPKLNLDVKGLVNIYLFNFKIDQLINAVTRKNIWVPIYKKYPIVPKIERDINLLFKNKYLISEIILFIKKTGKKLLEDVALIDIYTDPNLDDDLINYTFRLSYRDTIKTLKEEDISDIHENIINNIEKKFSAKLKK